MKVFRNLLCISALALAALPVAAQQKGHAIPATSASDTVRAEVRKVDKQARKLTLKHGELKDLGMGPMVMVFQVHDAALLDKATAGQQVKATLQKVNGVLSVTALEPWR
ncbi:MAG: copper-binding protein [Pseudoduganella sp.]|jgi:Cu/Ag efflux protein CusF|nr:copper-binding protein [Pseudoduganella sp.]